MNRLLILILVLGSAWYIVEQLEKHSEVPLSEGPSGQTKNFNRFPSSISECKGPCLSLTVQPSGQSFAIDAEDDVVNISLLKGDQLKVKLLNSKDFDLVHTYGSNIADFSQQKLVINWTESDVSEMSILENENRFRFYRTQWRNIGEAKFETAVFAIDNYNVKSPEFVLHHQPAGGGIQQLTFVSLEKNGSQVAKETTPPLIIARNSLFGYEISDTAKILIDCVYQAPNGSEENCSSWTKSRMIRSTSEQDVGLHKIKIITAREDFDFQFRVLGLQ